MSVCCARLVCCSHTRRCSVGAFRSGAKACRQRITNMRFTTLYAANGKAYLMRLKNGMAEPLGRAYEKPGICL